MGGGPKPAWDRVAPILEAIAARFEGEPCATWMGTDGAGHFVKTVHNGIEYADMQMIAEVYGIMRDGLGFARRRRRGGLRGLEPRAAPVLPVEITGKVARATDPETGLPDRRRHPRQRRPEGHRPLDGDRGAAARRPGHAPSRPPSPPATSPPASTNAPPGAELFPTSPSGRCRATPP